MGAPVGLQRSVRAAPRGGWATAEDWARGEVAGPAGRAGMGWGGAAAAAEAGREGLGGLPCGALVAATPWPGAADPGGGRAWPAGRPGDAALVAWAARGCEARLVGRKGGGAGPSGARPEGGAEGGPGTGAGTAQESEAGGLRRRKLGTATRHCFQERPCSGPGPLSQAAGALT